ncbi:hypothetical protein [Streptomyces cucumeris]|uniref:hypothetical protein n=1 Tax=Streptomyces cucumeris TaxID=2962890 RepID=UPI003EBD76D9
MTFDKEWGELRASAAAEQRTVHTRLNQTDPPGPLIPGLPDFSTSSSKKKTAVKALEDHVQPETKTAGECPDTASETAQKEFKDWATGSGITDALKGWHASVKALQDRLAAEKVALSTARKSFLLQDQANGGLFLPLLPDQDGKYPPNTPYSSGISQYGVK